MIDHSWRDKAVCNNADVNLFFPPRDKALYRTVADQAKEFCFGKDGESPCPVRAQCLWYAIDSDEVHGIWGGMSHRERNALVRKWRKNFSDQMSLQEYVLQIGGEINGSNKRRV
jgi:WhiB family transcriptional regulator, redox-sensing transcriptional regulator